MKNTATAQGGTELQLAAWRRQVPPALQAQVHLSVSAVAGPQRPLKPHVFWAHQAADQPSVQNLADPLVQRGIDAWVFVSQWQRTQYVERWQLPRARTYVVRNAIEPIPLHTKPAGPLRLIYTATPFRGLDVLLDAFAGLPERTEVELHIYSGMALYGRPGEDARYAARYAQARALPNVHYHGVVPNAEVRAALQQSHIFAYPCTWEETSCVALIEALSAGCRAVVPELAALPETASGYGQVYPYTSDREAHVGRFRAELGQAIRGYHQPAVQQALSAQVAHFAAVYSWERRRGDWTEVLENIITTYGRDI